MSKDVVECYFGERPAWLEASGTICQVFSLAQLSDMLARDVLARDKTLSGAFMHCCVIRTSTNGETEIRIYLRKREEDSP
jgi:hypothetical protein